jgi:uncharacterized Zn-binding protein involved in type VI secretion
MPPCSIDVVVNGLPVARATDALACAGPGAAPDFIVTGSTTVLINGLPAARQLDMTMHGPGQVIVGSLNVIIGGPTGGAALGNMEAGEARFLSAAEGRSSKRTQQSYGNCGIESARQIIAQATGSTISEDGLLNDSVSHNEAVNSTDPTKLGGSWNSTRQSLLERHFVPSSSAPNSLPSIVQAVAERRGVISSHDVSVLWGPTQAGGHAVVVTGLTYNDSGELENVVINDTGTGQASRHVPAKQFEDSLLPGADANVTDAPIW